MEKANACMYRSVLLVASVSGGDNIVINYLSKRHPCGRAISPLPLAEPSAAARRRRLCEIRPSIPNVTTPFRVYLGVAGRPASRPDV